MLKKFALGICLIAIIGSFFDKEKSSSIESSHSKELVNTNTEQEISVTNLSATTMNLSSSPRSHSEQCLIAKKVVEKGGNLILALLKPFPSFSKAEYHQFAEHKTKNINPKLTQYNNELSPLLENIRQDEEILMKSGIYQGNIGLIANQLLYAVREQNDSKKKLLINEIRNGRLKEQHSIELYLKSECHF